MRISESSASSFGEKEFLFVHTEINDKIAGFFIGYQSSYREEYNESSSACPVHFFSDTTLSILCPYHFGVPETDESILIACGFENYISSLPAVSAVRSSVWNTFFASPGHASISSFSSFEGDDDFINKHGRKYRGKTKIPKFICQNLLFRYTRRIHF